MAQASYIPTREADLFTWAENFSTLITASPATYGLVAGDAVAIAGVVDPYLAAYTLALNPSTRTKPTVAAKDAARAAMLALVRVYAIQIRDNLGVTNEAKLDLGLNVPTDTRSPILVPQTQPLLQIVAATPLAHTLRFSDANSPQLRGKPFGAKALYCVVSYGTAIGSNPLLASPAFLTNSALAVPSESGIATRQPFAVLHDTAEVGKVATFWGRWLGVRGDNGPWSLPVAMNVADASTGS